MVPDYHHLPIGEDLGVEGKKVEERVIIFRDRKLVTFRAEGKSIYEKENPIKTSYVIVPGFMERERYKISDFNVPISEVSLVKEDEKEEVIATVAKEYGIPRLCIRTW
jgi:uncharacterized protein with PIN domain